MGLFGPKSKEYGDLNRQSITEIQETTEEVKQEVQFIQSDPFAGSDPGLVPASNEDTQAKFLRGDGSWANPPGGGGGGTSDYEDLANKPAIDGTTLDKNSTAEGLGLAKSTDIPDLTDYAKKSDIPDVSGFLTEETDPTVPSWAKQPNPPNVTPNPTGTIISFFGESAPTGYLVCDGTAYNKVDYPVLSAHLLSLTDHSAYEVDGDSTKFKVPDLRGEFLRGTGTNGHADNGDGANVGIHQDGTFMPHMYDATQLANFNALYITSVPSINGDGNNRKLIRNDDKTRSARTYGDSYRTRTKLTGTFDSESGDSSSIDYPSLYSTRPTNTSVLYCIKY